jgi:hypothetical protein
VIIYDLGQRTSLHSLILRNPYAGGPDSTAQNVKKLKMELFTSLPSSLSTNTNTTTNTTETTATANSPSSSSSSPFITPTARGVFLLTNDKQNNYFDFEGMGRYVRMTMMENYGGNTNPLPRWPKFHLEYVGFCGFPLYD